MGRKTTFKKKYIKEIIEFFTVEPQRKELMETMVEHHKDGSERKTSEKYRLIPNKLPTLFGFAKSIGVDYDTVLGWKLKGESLDLDKVMSKKGVSKKEVLLARDLSLFVGAYKEAKELQQEFLMAIGLSGAAPSSAFIFTAKNITGMRDKSVHDVTHRSEKPLLDNLDMQDVILNNNSDEESDGTDQKN